MSSSLKKIGKEEEIIYLSQNLSTLLKRHNLSPSRLANTLNIPLMTVRRLLSGETTDPRISTLQMIAQHFDISIDFLMGEHSSINAPHLKKHTPFYVPKLSWEIAKKINHIRELDLNQWKEWQTVSSIEPHTVGKNAFALESRPFMYPRFPQGAIFIIDPDIEPVDGDIVLVKIKENNELTLRDLIIDPPEWQLHPVVAGSSVVHYTKECHQIVGIGVLTILYNRKN